MFPVLGEQRLSGYLPYQSTYSELLFIKKLWPELKYADFDNILLEYTLRKRRLGK